MLPEELARVKIDKQLTNAGWEIVPRSEYISGNTTAVKEALMQGNTESDYLLFVDDKAIAVVEAKKESSALGEEVAQQAEEYSVNPQSWYGLWFPHQIPLVYLANGHKIFFKNMLKPDSEYEELPEMHTPKKMLQIIGKNSVYGALPRIEKKGLRESVSSSGFIKNACFTESVKRSKTMKPVCAILARIDLLVALSPTPTR